MATSRPTDPPLDEIQWRSPAEAASMSGIHTNSILHYFARSPFFDPTSNNAILVSQLQYNPNMSYVIATRTQMEARLATMSGLEFIVAQEPAEMDPGTGTGVWVIRKQTRRKRAGEEDEIVVKGLYFCVGENIYMAPTVADILGNRMLNIFKDVSDFFETAASLPTFTPATGHTYTPPTTSSNRPKSLLDSLTGRNTSSRQPSPSPRPESQLSPGRSSRLLSETNTSSHLQNLLLQESIRLSFQYGDEYMDENPVTGQPGDFHFTNTGRKPAAVSKLMVPIASKGPLSVQTSNTEESVVSLSDMKPADATKSKSAKGDKSPRTPGMPKPKRRKSKASISEASRA